jgi:hypothetical protein
VTVFPLITPTPKPTTQYLLFFNDMNLICHGQPPLKRLSIFE